MNRPLTPAAIDRDGFAVSCLRMMRRAPGRSPMPVHDWSRVRPGIFHAFHQAWIFALQAAMNRSLLPPGYGALGERVVPECPPDFIVHKSGSTRGNEDDRRESFDF